MTSIHDIGSKSSISLKIRGCGNPNAFKNRKRIVAPGNGRRPMLITDKAVKAKMDAMTDVLESELRSAFQTATAATQMGAPPHYWTVLSTPADDCWTQIPELIITSELVPIGEEGADIEITPL